MYVTLKGQRRNIYLLTLEWYNFSLTAELRGAVGSRELNVFHLTINQAVWKSTVLQRSLVLSLSNYYYFVFAYDIISF